MPFSLKRVVVIK
ncbi:hypothetical protein A2U01_0074215, partial [Trifolium medium]|nr:hypothetical protein [Trifolium medium]